MGNKARGGTFENGATNGMKGKRKEKAPSRGKHVVYVLAASGMLLYGMGDMRLDGGDRAQTWFWLIWLTFAAAILAANMNALLMSGEKRRRMAKLKILKARQREQALEKLLMKRYEAKNIKARSR